MEIIIAPIVSFLAGIVLAYLAFRFNLLQGKVQIRRERLLKSIAIVEQFISNLLQLEYLTYRLAQNRENTERITEEKDNLKEELDLIEREQKEIGQKISEHKANIVKLKRKQQTFQAERKNIQNNVGRKFAEIENGVRGVEEDISKSPEKFPNPDSKESKRLENLKASLNEESQSLEKLSENAETKIEEIDEEYEKLDIELGELDNNLTKYSNRLSEIRVAVEKKNKDYEKARNLLEASKKILDELEAKIEEMDKYVFTSDLDNTLRYIDPSNQLGKHVAELIECSRSIERVGNPDRAMQLRYLIKNLLEQKIK